MLGLYLFAFVLGGGFLILSLFGGEGAEAEVDVDFDTELDADGAGDPASKIFSIRGLVYTLFGFGATGSLLTAIGVGTGVTLASSVLGGLTSGALITGVFRWLARTDSGSHPGDASLVGSVGRVTLPVTPTSAGTVIVARGGREVPLRALPHGAATGAPEEWTRVVVVEIDGSGIARVAPLNEGELTGGS